MKHLKKILALLLSALILINLVACSVSSSSSNSSASSDSSQSSNDSPQTSGTKTEKGAQTPGDFKTFTIGVVESQAVDETVLRREYFENYIAPQYNVKFIFSEICDQAPAAISFIENCADSGADAILYFGGGTDAYQLTQICQDYGMCFIYNGNREVAEDTFDADFDNFGGCYGSSPYDMSAGYRKYLEANIDKNSSDGFLILSGKAARGNLQHSEITVAMLETLADMYGLTYNQDITEMATTSAPLDAKNDKGLEIYICPGNTNDEGWLSSVSAMLQTGKYTYLISSFPSYTQTSVVVDEVENTFDFNITAMSVGSTGPALTTAMNTLDKFGNPSVDFVAVSMASLKSVGLFGMAYNCLTGYKDNMRGEDGKMSKFEFSQIFITSAEQLEDLSNWDSNATNKWAAGYSYLDGMLGIYNPDITHDEIWEHLMNASEYDAIYKRLED